MTYGPESECAIPTTPQRPTIWRILVKNMSTQSLFLLLNVVLNLSILVFDETFWWYYSFVFLLFIFIFYFVCTIFHVPACSSTFCLAKLYFAGIDRLLWRFCNMCRGMCKWCVQPACLFENLTSIYSFLIYVIGKVRIGTTSDLGGKTNIVTRIMS